MPSLEKERRKCIKKFRKSLEAIMKKYSFIDDSLEQPINILNPSEVKSDYFENISFLKKSKICKKNSPIFPHFEEVYARLCFKHDFDDIFRIFNN